LQAKRNPNDVENAMLGAVAGTTYPLKPLLKYSLCFDIYVHASSTFTSWNWWQTCMAEVIWNFYSFFTLVSSKRLSQSAMLHIIFIY